MIRAITHGQYPSLYGLPLDRQLRTHWKQYRAAPPHMKRLCRDVVRKCIEHIRWRREGWLEEVRHEPA